MFRKFLAAVLRFVHDQKLLLQLADYLESAPVEVPEGANNGEPAPQ